MNVLREARHITRISKSAGGIQMAMAPYVPTGTLYGRWRSGLFILSCIKAANSRSIPSAYKKLRNSMISWKLIHDKNMTPVADNKMLIVGVPYLDLEKHCLQWEITKLSKRQFNSYFGVHFGWESSRNKFMQETKNQQLNYSKLLKYWDANYEWFLNALTTTWFIVYERKATKQIS